MDLIELARSSLDIGLVASKGRGIIYKYIFFSGQSFVIHSYL